MDALSKANEVADSKRIQIEPLNKKPRGRPKLSPSKRKNKPKTGGVETHVLTDARKKGIKKMNVMRSIKAEERRKAKQTESISKTNMFPNPKDNFNITDENHEESKVLLNPEPVMNEKKPKPYSDGKNQIDQYEIKLQELGKQYTSEIDGLKQQIDRLINKPKKPRKKREKPNSDNVVNGEGDLRVEPIIRGIGDNVSMHEHHSIFNPSPFQHIHAFNKSLRFGNSQGVGAYTGQAPVQESGYNQRY